MPSSTFDYVLAISENLVSSQVDKGFGNLASLTVFTIS